MIRRERIVTMTVMTKNDIDDVQRTEVHRTIEMVETARVVGKKNGIVNENGTEAASDAKIDMMNASDTTGNTCIRIEFGQFDE